MSTSLMLLAQNSFPYGQEFESVPGQTVDLGGTIKAVTSQANNVNDSFIEQVLKVFGFNVGQNSGGAQTVTIYTYIQSIFNIAIGLLAMISVIILIYNFFMIFFGKDKEGVENAQKAVKRVAYVIIIIGLSWLVVSFLFWLAMIYYQLSM